MAAAAATTVLLLCCSVFTSAVSKDGCDHYIVTNGDFTVPLNHQLKSTEQLRWNHDGSIIFDRRDNQMLNGKEGDVYQNGSLKLTKVDKTKGGTYTPEVYLDGQRKEKMKSIRLCVQDRVMTPRVTFQCSKKGVTVTCSIKQRDLNFEWLQNDKVLKKDSQTFQASDLKGFETDAFRCRASNQVSSETSPPATQTCVKTGFAFPEKLLGVNTWIFVGGGAGVVLILIVIVIACCIRNRRKRRMLMKEEEELRLGWTNKEQPHPHHHHPPHPHRRQQQQQPAGHTGPRQHRSNQHHPRGPEHPNGHPQANPRRAVQVPRPVNDDDEQPPPLPQPRKKAPKTPRM